MVKSASCDEIRVMNNKNWKFKEPRNLAVFTTEAIMNKKESVVWVHHNKDGAWQFLPGRKVSVKEAKIISLAAIVFLDPSIELLVDLPLGYKALKEPDGNWKTVKED